jgi:uncharacterized protein
MIDRACISLNHRCNLHCKYCHFSGKYLQALQDEMEFTDYEVQKIIDNIAEYCRKNNISLFKLGIVGSGEPLLSFVTLATLVIRAKEIGNGLFKLYTITNGVDLTDEQLNVFKENRDVIDVNFSLDGYEELHNFNRQKFGSTMKSILKYEVLFGHKPIINCTVTKQSLIHSDKLIRFFIDNRFTKINFSIISEVDDKNLVITQSEYNSFLDMCEATGIIMRQRKNTLTPIYDCAMYGKLCGVGQTNIFITRSGIYPCGRFFGMEKYRIADWFENFEAIEQKITTLKDVASGKCFYETVITKNFTGEIK